MKSFHKQIILPKSLAEITHRMVDKMNKRGWFDILMMSSVKACFNFDHFFFKSQESRKTSFYIVFLLIQ